MIDSLKIREKACAHVRPIIDLHLPDEDSDWADYVRDAKDAPAYVLAIALTTNLFAWFEQDPIMATLYVETIFAVHHPKDHAMCTSAVASLRYPRNITRCVDAFFSISDRTMPNGILVTCLIREFQASFIRSRQPDYK